MKCLSFYIIFAVVLITSPILSADRILKGYRGILWETSLADVIISVENVFSEKATVDTTNPRFPKITVIDSLMDNLSMYRFSFTPLSRKFYSATIFCYGCDCDKIEAILNDKYQQSFEIEEGYFWKLKEGTIILYCTWPFFIRMYHTLPDMENSFVNDIDRLEQHPTVTLRYEKYTMKDIIREELDVIDKQEEQFKARHYKKTGKDEF